jgi:fatty-acyl-CoA synthase
MLPGVAPTPAAYAKMIAEERPTVVAGVPTLFRDLLAYGEQSKLDLSSVRMAPCGGSAVPAALMERFEREYGVKVIQGWGLTESGPVAGLAIPPKELHGQPESYFRNKTGRVLGGVEIRVVNDAGKVMPHDGKSEGELELRGPWVTAEYYADPAPEKFNDGWLRTGDVGHVDPEGFVLITDRSKDVIKSGGEWISSVTLENLVMNHPAVREAAVIGVPDDKWQERPLACVVFRQGQSASPEELAAHLAKDVVSWWVPERWAFIAEVPKTSVGKFDKKELRARYAAGDFTVHMLKPG